MRKLGVFLGLFPMLLMMAAVAYAEQPIFPFADGYTATYAVTNSYGSKYSSELEITGTEIINGYMWSNWNLGGGSINVRCTADALYQYDPNQPNTSYSIPLFIVGQVGQNWSYTDLYGDSITATIAAIGPLTVPAGLFQSVYEVQYVAVDPQNNTDYWTYYWEPGIGFLEYDYYGRSLFSVPSTMKLASLPVPDVLVGTWTGKMEIVTLNDANWVETGTAQVTFVQIAGTAYGGALAWIPDFGSTVDAFSLPIAAIKGPFDPTQLHITSPCIPVSEYSPVGMTFGQMRQQAGQWVIDLRGSDLVNGYTFSSLGLSKE
jgi:hypothetical protein